MNEPDFERLAEVLALDDAAFRERLPEVVDEVEDHLPQLLLERPELYERLIGRVSTLDDLAAYAEEEPETVEGFLDVLWTGLGLISRAVPAVQEAVDESFAVNWEPRDADVTWHATTDAETGAIDGGPGLLDDADVTFRGSTDVLFSMLGDDAFDPALAYVQNRYEVLGSLEDARRFSELMEAAIERMEDVA